MRNSLERSAVALVATASLGILVVHLLNVLIGWLVAWLGRAPRQALTEIPA